MKDKPSQTKIKDPNHTKARLIPTRSNIKNMNLKGKKTSTPNSRKKKENEEERERVKKAVVKMIDSLKRWPYKSDDRKKENKTKSKVFSLETFVLISP